MESESRLRDLRRVVPIAQTQSIGGVIITLFALDDYAEGFAVRLRMLLEDWHPVAVEARARDATFHRERNEAVQREQEADFVRDQEMSFLRGNHESIPYPDLELEARDDLGRPFELGYGGGSRWGSDLEGWLDVHYVPALGTSVRSVQLEVPDVQWRRNWGKREGGVERVDRGPWTFVVAL